MKYTLRFPATVEIEVDAKDDLDALGIHCEIEDCIDVDRFAQPAKEAIRGS